MNGCPDGDLWAEQGRNGASESHKGRSPRYHTGETQESTDGHGYMKFA